jgi:sec-independent protein translocase protein TatB
MLNLDPAKLLVIAVVAIILLGPDRLPQVARQVGAAWRSFNEFRHRMETEVRSTMPDLPPTHEIARLARSPSALLNKLSSMSDGDGNGTEANGAVAGTGTEGNLTGDGGNGAVAGTGAEANGTSAAPGVGAGVGSNGDSSSLPDGAAAVGPVAGRPAPAPDGVVSGADVVTEGAESTPAPGPAPAATRPAPGPVSPAPSPEVITPGDPTLN